MEMEGFGFVKAHSNSWDEKRVIYRGMERRFYCLVKGVKFDSGNLRLPANHKKTLDTPDDDTWWVPYRDAFCSVGSNCGASDEVKLQVLETPYVLCSTSGVEFHFVVPSSKLFQGGSLSSVFVLPVYDHLSLIHI